MGPFKCPDCGVWWAGFEHRCSLVDLAPECQCPAVWHGIIPPYCPLHNPGSRTVVGTSTAPDFTVPCTCPQPIDWSRVYIGDPPPCPVHGGNSTFTYAATA